jgi:hypothetical protein
VKEVGTRACRPVIIVRSVVPTRWLGRVVVVSIPRDLRMSQALWWAKHLGQPVPTAGSAPGLTVAAVGLQYPGVDGPRPCEG